MTNNKQYQIQSFIDGYQTCLSWMAECHQYDYSDTAYEKNRKDCGAFVNENYALLCQYVDLIVPNEWDAWERAGHDFALTRNGYGTGFWDRDYKDKEGDKVGQALTNASKKAGEVYLYINDCDEIETE